MTQNRTEVPRRVVLIATLLVLAAAGSAGIHAGLVPEHLGEMPLLGVSFIFAVLALLAIASAVAIRPEAQLPASLAALLFAGLILAYVVSRTTGLPILEPEPERVDAIGVVTVAVQLFGLLAALWLTRTAGRQRSVLGGTPQSAPSGSRPHRSKSLVLAGLVAIAFAVVALGAAGHDEEHDHGEVPGHEEADGHGEMHDEAGTAAIPGME